MTILILVVHYAVLTISWLLIAYIVLSYFMDHNHPVKRTIDSIVEPMLAPIRRILPSTGMFDFSPLVLIILLQVIEYILRSLLLSLAG
ncbi:MAG: hypothetical protein A2Z49_10690 [Chloroflexi bacterium RBG_19FT_COMBO_56_12]|nr:MAG: hypothetical protein A2Z49_10690 [Chloroflexi bacterium RBG_19FT_COMBO_56_12]